MKYIDPHIHMVSRTTDDYQRMEHLKTQPLLYVPISRNGAPSKIELVKSRQLFIRRLLEVLPVSHMVANDRYLYILTQPGGSSANTKVVRVDQRSGKEHSNQTPHHPRRMTPRHGQPPGSHRDGVHSQSALFS